MDKRALEDLLAEYAALREQNRREEERRRQEISEKHPDLEALLQERHEMVLSSVLSAFSDRSVSSSCEVNSLNRTNFRNKPS